MRWRYRAIALRGTGALDGEMAAESAADVRASLRRSGLRAVRVRMVRPLALPGWMPARDRVARTLRARRRAAKAELFESLATMLEAGISLPQALEAIAASARSTRTRRRQEPRATDAATASQPRPTRSAPVRGRVGLAARLRDAVNSGASLAEAAAPEPMWFDAPEVAMIRAGEHSGELARVLRNLTERHERAGELGSRIAAALAYPTIVAAVGIGVVLFLSTQTLPQLVGVLEQARIPVPGLTRGVMRVGAAIAAAWKWSPPVALGVASAVLAARTLARRLRRSNPPIGEIGARLTPRTLRETCLSAALLDLSDVLRAGVPLTDAIRVVAPSLAGLGAPVLRARLVEASTRIERGESLSQALDDPAWFDAEVVRLISVGEEVGDLHVVLHQLGEARRRRARRLVDRLTAFLEPAVIVVLAIFVGIVVMSAVLPMLRLQEVIG